MIKRFLIAAALAVFLTACATGGGGTFCDIAAPIRLSPAVIDTMTDAEVDRALAHNELGARLCDWRP